MDARFSTAVEILAVLDIEAGSNITSHEIAARLKTDPARVRQIFALLSRAGLMRSQRGPMGGASLAKPAEEITLGAIFLAVRSKGTLISLTRPAPKDKQRRLLNKLVQDHVLNAEAAFVEKLDAVSLATLVRQFGPSMGY
jgi:Rrf2 family protein